jgi:hypothetical protein
MGVLPNPQYTYILMSFMAISLIEFHVKDTNLDSFLAKSEQIQGNMLSYICYVEMLNGKTC